HRFFVPAPLVEIAFDALTSPALQGRLARLAGPTVEARHDGSPQELRRAFTPVLPGEVAIPALPARFALAIRHALARESEVGDRHEAPAGAGFRAVAVGEGVELLDIAQRMVGLALDPGAQAGLQRRMIAFERSGRKQRTVFQGKHLRCVV